MTTERDQDKFSQEQGQKGQDTTGQQAKPGETTGQQGATDPTTGQPSTTGQQGGTDLGQTGQDLGTDATATGGDTLTQKPADIGGTEKLGETGQAGFVGSQGEDDSSAEYIKQKDETGNDGEEASDKSDLEGQ